MTAQLKPWVLSASKVSGMLPRVSEISPPPVAFPPPIIAAKSFANTPAGRWENTCETVRRPPLVGLGLGEHACAYQGLPQFGMTEEERVERRGALTPDRKFINRRLAGDHEANARMKTL